MGRALLYGVVLAAGWWIVSRSPFVAAMTLLLAPVSALEARHDARAAPRADAALVTSLVFAVIELYRRTG